MQFSTAAIFAAAASVAVSASVVTETDYSSTLVTITSCASDVTNCPAREHSTSAAAESSVVSSSNSTANITTYEGAAHKQFAAGAVALAAGALLAL